jgi:signal transduction histidine kinase
MRARSLRVAIAIVGFAWGLFSEAVLWASGTTAVDVLRDLAIGWTYLYGGLAIWSSRPANPTGRLMTLVGVTWFIGNLQLSTVSPFRELGTAFADVVFVCLISLILVYPSGWLETRLDRAVVVVLAIGTTLNNAVRLVPLDDGVALENVRLYVGLGLAILAYAAVIRRWIVAPAPRRSELVPVLIGGVVLMAVLATSLAVQAISIPDGPRDLLLAARGLAPAAIPLALLVGFYRQSEVRQRSLVDAIPDLMLRFTRDGHLLDVRGNESPLLTRPDRPQIARRIHDVLPLDVAESLLDGASRAIDSGSIQAFDLSVTVAGQAREFEARMTPSGADEVTAIVRDFSVQRAAQAELRRSRSRIIEAADAERRRLERDLHDGAQQRLVSLSLALRLARSKLGAGDDRPAAAALESASAELKTALAELRNLARGIHPVILTEAGLGPAIDSLAAGAPVPTTVLGHPDRRFSANVEATAYFIVSEALANVAKHASARAATVSAASSGDFLRVEVVDDGVGGADAGGGSGLRGLTDRVAALGGRLNVESPRGGGTRVVAEIPFERVAADRQDG